MIGIFDSGSGGLSILAALRRIAPDADIAYFGDIKNVPYGLKARDELERLAYQGIATLKTMRASELIAGCNSVSPLILSGAADETPIVEMSMPTTRALRERAGERFLLIATPATVRSNLYQYSLGKTVELDALPLPELASGIEFGAPEAELERILREAFDTRRGERYTGLILGCTHYPLARDLIERVSREYFGELEMVDPAEAVAQEAAARFDTSGEGKILFRISADSPEFRERVSALFPDAPKTIEVR